MADFNSVAQEFVKFYYDTFDSNRGNLSALYRDASMLTFENTPIQGVAGIMEKLGGLPFQQVKHRVDTLDAQPGYEPGKEDGSIICLVTGALLVDAEQRPMSYTQVFHLKQEGNSQYYVLNDVFRLVYAAA